MGIPALNINEFKDIYLGLGGNLGEPLKTIPAAIKLLESRLNTKITTSLLYETLPLTSPKIQEITAPNYINCVVHFSSEISPSLLLELILDVEKVLGRDRSSEKRWGSRIIDIDILFMGDLVVATEQLTIPHPEIAKRDFVLVPLAELNPHLLHPTLKEPTHKILKGLYKGRVKKHVLRTCNSANADYSKNPQLPRNL